MGLKENLVWILLISSRKKVHISELVQLQEFEPQSSTSYSIPLCVQSESAPYEFNDLDLSIAVWRGTQECTKHPVSNSVSFHSSTQHKTFLSTINAFPIPQSLEKFSNIVPSLFMFVSFHPIYLILTFCILYLFCRILFDHSNQENEYLSTKISILWPNLSHTMHIINFVR